MLPTSVDMQLRNVPIEYWWALAGGALLAYEVIRQSQQAAAPAPKDATTVATVGGVALRPGAALVAAVAAYPRRVARITVTKARTALSDLWPQVRTAKFVAAGWAGVGTRANQPALDYDDAISVVSAALQAATAGIRHHEKPFIANYGFSTSFVDNSEAFDNSQLTDLGRKYKQAAAALLILTRANFGADISALMIQNCTDAAQRLCEACDDTSYSVPINNPSVLDSLGVGIGALPDTLSGAASGIADAAAGVLGDVVGAVVFSTPVLIAAVGLAWWKLA